MRILSLTQPWASAIPLGLKTWETRSWPTKYRGPVGIHAAKGFPKWAKEFAETERALGRIPARLPLGAVIAVVDLTDCVWATHVSSEVGAIERLYGDYSPGRFAWKLENIRALAVPIGWKGALGLQFPTEPLYRAIMQQLEQTP
jgi:hypothetical protein